MDLVGPIIWVITLVIAWSGALLAAFAAVDSVSRRADAYAAADKQTKGTWVGINVACGAVMALGIVSPLFEPPGILWLAASVGTLVYLLDVRPRLREVQNGNRW